MCEDCEEELKERVERLEHEVEGLSNHLTAVVARLEILTDDFRDHEILASLHETR